MGDGTTVVPGRTPDGLSEAWGANLKETFDRYAVRLAELDQAFDDGQGQMRAQYNKLVQDAQSASNLALLNAVKFTAAAAWQSLRHGDIGAANMAAEQADVGLGSADDVTKAMEDQTVNLSSLFTTKLDALTAQISLLVAAVGQVIVGRPTGTAPEAKGTAAEIK
jgi:hypothetical protein